MSNLKPTYKTIPTIRDYDEYVLEAEYVKGWNDAMDFIFPEEKKKREKEKSKKTMRIIKNG